MPTSSLSETVEWSQFNLPRRSLKRRYTSKERRVIASSMFDADGQYVSLERAQLAVKDEHGKQWLPRV